VFWGIIRNADQLLTHQLDEGLYSSEETIELKIPITLPYPMQEQGFKRVDGKFEHQGEFYKLVKHKLANDTVYIVCIRDHQQKRLVKTMVDYSKVTNELPASSKKAPSFSGKFFQDFESTKVNEILHVEGWSMDIHGIQHSTETQSPQVSIVSPPPRG
jgi:hypothetical protein